MKQSCLFLAFCFALTLPVRAQFISVSGGGLFSQDKSAPSTSRAGGREQLDFSRAPLVAVDAGSGILPFIAAGVHYSFSRPDAFLRRGDAFGSSAEMQLPTHTVTFDLRLRTPRIVGFRAYGLVGAGLSRFNLKIRRQVEVPFPRGIPDNLTAPVVTFGGGGEQSVFPFVALKFEVRDYVTPLPERLFGPGDRFHRVAVLGGIVLGR